MKSWHRVLLQQPVAAAIKEGIHQPHHEELPRGFSRFFPSESFPHILYLTYIPYIYISLSFPHVSHIFPTSHSKNLPSSTEEHCSEARFPKELRDLRCTTRDWTWPVRVTRSTISLYQPYHTRSCVAILSHFNGDLCAYLIHVLSFGG